ncbi:Phage shock protein PspC (stress-responsive transcriptional regulator) [Lentibacillus persicus]|uniref:Phage shock protein PspC (Stress-responsive transcriptional regulator) n=1 Tax=Lentibacillus persicus TaxID=640948 RepID=A0A1I1WPP6_9BACI|nr:PspC domain-containing protein [Lentibacillus persicus]SFD96368.1 Phage shock protein PspC (stress-responsive transcriptional regulator) [Lentibacillus persicus]
MSKRLYRSNSERMVKGICGGLAEYFNIDPTIVRLIFVALAFAGGASIYAYLIGIFVIPNEREVR